jgi:hypothetical protein
MRPTIRLWSLPHEAMFVIEHPSGVVYTNQTGGTACDQPELEGVLVPLDLEPEQSERLAELCLEAGRLSTELADTIDTILAKAPGGLRVDRARLHDSHEAWIFVVGETPPARDDESGDWFGDWFGFAEIRGVVTWPNSD